MAWAKLDDGFHAHPKVQRVGLAAVGLHVITISHCSRYLTDGLVGPELVRQVAQRQAAKLTRDLVAAGLWERDGGEGWTVHDYLDYNPSRAHVVEARQKESERKGRSNSGRNPAGTPAPASAQPRVPVPYPFPERLPT
jgi:hypothetical protein